MAGILPHKKEREGESNMPYRKIDTKIWNDEKFNSLSDDAKLVWFFLLTHPGLTSLGAMRATIQGLAAELKRSEKRFRIPFEELLKRGMVKVDETAFTILIPNFLKYNPPDNPNVVKSWVRVLDRIPEGRLKDELLQGVMCVLEGYGEPYREPFRNPMPKQEQEQELEQEQESREKEKIIKKEKDPSSCPKRVFPDWIDETLFNEYVKHRKALRKPMTEKAIDLAIKTLDRFRTVDGLDPNEIIEQSIANGWQGLFAPKQQQTARKEKKDARHKKPDYTKTGGFVTD